MNPKSPDIQAPIPDAKQEEEKVNKYVEELRKPENKKDLDTFAKAYFDIREKFLSDSESMSDEEAKKIRETMKEEVIHALIDINTHIINEKNKSELYTPDEIQFLHEIADIWFRRSDFLKRDKESKQKQKEWEEKFYQKAKEYALKNFDIEGYLAKGLELMIRDRLCMEDPRGRERYNRENEEWKDPVKMFTWLRSDREFSKEHSRMLSEKEKINISEIGILNSGFLNKLMKIVEDTGDISKVKNYANYERNAYLLYEKIYAESFDMERFLREYLEENPQVIEKLKEIEKKYVVNLYLPEENKE